MAWSNKARKRSRNCRHCGALLKKTGGCSRLKCKGNTMSEVELELHRAFERADDDPEAREFLDKHIATQTRLIREGKVELIA